MKKLLFVIFMSALFGVSTNAQTPAATATPAPKAQAESKPKRQTFRANKEQITQAQKMMKATETGKMDDDFRAAYPTLEVAKRALHAALLPGAEWPEFREH